MPRRSDDGLDARAVRDDVLAVAAERAGGSRDGAAHLEVAMALRGVVLQGVEWHSVILRTDDGRTFQLGGHYAQYTGSRVQVLGRPRTDLAGTAQEGVPLLVVSIDVLDGE